MSKNGQAQDFTCTACGAHWVGAAGRCPRGCDAVAKSHGEFTKKTFQGESDLKKGGR